MFDKAVDEANYSFMYAKLCVRLNDLAPNFDDTSGATVSIITLGLRKGKIYICI